MRVGNHIQEASGGVCCSNQCMEWDPETIGAWSVLQQPVHGVGSRGNYAETHTTISMERAVATNMWSVYSEVSINP